MKNRTLLSTLLALFLVSSTAVTHADIRGDTEPFVEEQVTVVQVNDADGNPVEGAKVNIVYYPGSDVEHAESAGTTNANGEVEWTPHYAGLARLEWSPPGSEEMSEARVIGVRYQAMPKPALAMFVVALLMLFGGLILGVSRMRRAEEP